jgi:predicted alpha/beta hydrolase family esterase
MSSFAPLPLARLAFRSVVVASRNDPYVPFNRACGFAEAWGAQLVDAGASGHINVDAGFGRWPAGEQLATQMSANVSTTSAA